MRCMDSMEPSLPDKAEDLSSREQSSGMGASGGRRAGKGGGVAEGKKGTEKGNEGEKKEAASSYSICETQKFTISECM